MNYDIFILEKLMFKGIDSLFKTHKSVGGDKYAT